MSNILGNTLRGFHIFCCSTTSNCTVFCAWLALGLALWHFCFCSPQVGTGYDIPYQGWDSPFTTVVQREEPLFCESPLLHS